MTPEEQTVIELTEQFERWEITLREYEQTLHRMGWTRQQAGRLYDRAYGVQPMWA